MNDTITRRLTTQSGWQIGSTPQGGLWRLAGVGPTEQATLLLEETPPFATPQACVAFLAHCWPTAHAGDRAIAWSGDW